MDNGPLACEHVQAAVDSPLTAQILQLEERCRHLWKVRNGLDAFQVLFHLVSGEADEIVDGDNFLLEFFDHSAERRWAVLSILGEGEDLALERLADAGDHLVHVGALLVDQTVHRLGLHCAFKVLHIEVLLVEAGQYFASRGPENQLFELGLLRVVDRARDIGNCNTVIILAPAAPE